MTLKEIEQAIRTLSLKDRTELVQFLLLSLEESPQASLSDKEWEAECTARLRELDEGKTKGILYADVLMELRQEFKWLT